MFEELRVYNRDRFGLSPLSIMLFNPGDYEIKFIDGLNPAPSTIVTNEYAFIEGSSFQSAKSQPRNIVLTVGFNPDYSLGVDYTALRRGLYSYLTPSTNVRMEFDLGGGEYRTIDGYVETHEADIFTKKPLSQISILCPDPYFKNLNENNEVVVDLSSVVSNDTAEVIVEYEGEVRNGLEMSIGGNNSDGWTITSSSGGRATGSMVIDGFDPLGSNLYLDINTTPGRKSVVYGSDSMLDVVGLESDWLGLLPGENTIEFKTQGTLGPSGDIRVKWVNLYGGL